VKIGVVKETADGERRVALVPEVLARLQQAGLEVLDLRLDSLNDLEGVLALPHNDDA